MKIYNREKTPRYMRLTTDPNQGPNRPRVMTKERHTTMGKPQIKHQLTETRGLTDPT